MSDSTKISWADSTYNHWIGCTNVGPGCDHCYAETMDARKVFQGVTHWGSGKPRMLTSDKNRNRPLLWEKNHAEFFAIHGHRRRVFCSSLADVFDNEVDPQWRHDLFALILSTPNLDWLLLTKRIGNVEKLVDKSVFEACPNIWLGATIVNQEEADRDIPKLLATPACIKFLSMEPLLGPIDIERWLDPTGVTCMDVCQDRQYVKDDEIETIKDGKEVIPICPDCGLVASWTGYDPGIDWVIAGGESGNDARPMHPDWVRSLRDQCKAAGVPFLFKQWGEYLPYSQRESGQISDSVHYPTVAFAWKVGKLKAGDLLDGVEHKEFPA